MTDSYPIREFLNKEYSLYPSTIFSFDITHYTRSDIVVVTCRISAPFSRNETYWSANRNVESETWKYFQINIMLDLAKKLMRRPT